MPILLLKPRGHIHNILPSQKTSRSLPCCSLPSVCFRSSSRGLASGLIGLSCQTSNAVRQRRHDIIHARLHKNIQPPTIFQPHPIKQLHPPDIVLCQLDAIFTVERNSNLAKQPPLNVFEIGSLATMLFVLVGQLAESQTCC